MDLRLLKKQSTFLFIGQGISFAIQLLTPVFLVRLISKSDYGMYQQFHLVCGALLPILGLCLNVGLYYFFPTAKEDDKKTYIIQTYFVLTLVGVLFFPIIIFFGDYLLDVVSLSSIKSFIYLVAGYLFFTLSSSIFDYIFILEKRYYPNLIFYPIDSLLRLLLLSVFAFVMQNTYGVLIGLVLYSLIKFLFIGIYLFKNYILKAKILIKYSFIKEQFKYSMPILGGLILQVIAMRYDKFLINSFISASEYAVYSIAFYNIPLLNIYYSSINNVVMPEISTQASKNEIINVKYLWHKVIDKTASITIPAVIFFAFMANEIIVILYTDMYKGAVTYYRIYLISLLFMMTSSGLILRGFKKTNYVFYANLIGTTATIIIGTIIIRYYFTYGAIATALMGIAIPIIIILWQEKKTLGLTIKDWLPWHNIFKILIISVVSSIPIIISKNVIHNSIVLIVVTTILYFSMVIILEYHLNIFAAPEFIDKIKSRILKKS